MTFFLVIFLLIFLLFAWRRLDLAVYFIIFAMPSYLIRPRIFSLPSTLLEMAILISFFVFFAQRMRLEGTGANLRPSEKKSPFIYCLKIIKKIGMPLFLFLGLFLLASFFSIITSSKPLAAAGLWKAYFLEPILFFIVIINVLNKRSIAKIIFALSLSALLLSLFALYQKITGQFIANPFWAAAASRRVTSFFPYPNALSLYLAPIITLIIGIFTAIISRSAHVSPDTSLARKQISGSLKIICFLFLVIAAGVLAIYWTGSKGALLGLITGLIFYALFYPEQKRYFASLLGIIFLVAFFFFGVLKNPLNLEGKNTVSGGGSLTTRLDLWRETFNLLKDKPLSGSGLAGFQTALVPYHQKDYVEIYLYPHNIFLNFWVETGFFGLLAFLLIISWFYRLGYGTLRRNISNQNQSPNYRLAVSFMAALTCLIIHGLVDVPYFKNDLSVLFWTIGALIVLLARDEADGSGEDLQLAFGKK